MLLQLTSKDFKEKSVDRDFEKYGDGNVMIFIKDYWVFDLHSNKCLIEFYIKYKERNDNRKVPVLSFHESDRD